MRTRFLEVIKYAREHEKPDWLHIAAEYGYSDQSHFINDFKKLTGESPSQYLLTNS
jgi:AraC-like DNA-binding protein